MHSLSPAAPPPLASSSPLLVDVEREDTRVHVRPRGELDLSNADQLRGVLAAHAVPGRRLVLDLSQLSFIDSAGLRVLLSAQSLADAGDLWLTITNGGHAVRRAVEILGLTDRLPIVNSDRAHPAWPIRDRGSWCPS